MGRHVWNDLPPDEPRRYGATLEARARCARCGLVLLWRRKRGVAAVFATVRTPGRPRSPILVRWADPPGCIVVSCESCDSGGSQAGPHAEHCALRYPELAAIVPLLSLAQQDDMMCLRWSMTRTAEELLLEGLLEAGRDRAARVPTAQIAGRYQEARGRGTAALLWVKGWEPDVFLGRTRAALLQTLHERSRRGGRR